MVETQDTELIISPKIYNGKKNNGSPKLLGAVWMKVYNFELVDVSFNEAQESNQDVQASEFYVQYCNSSTKDEVHQDNIFSDNREESYGINQLYVLSFNSSKGGRQSLI